MEAVRHTANPKFGGVVFRRTSPQITNEGGLWDASMGIYPAIGAVPQRTTLTWRFPSGSKIKFGHLQYEQNVLNWQGSEIAFIGFDELTHFTESQFFYMLSRNRSTCGVRPYIRATTNPAPGWVKSFLAPWLDKAYPNPAASGEMRWFRRREGQIIWVDEHDLDSDGHAPKSVTFIRSTVYDNKILLSVNPEYLTNLKSLPLVEQARLLHGDWDVFEGAFFSEWSETRHTEFPIPPPRHWQFFGGLDWGYAKPFCFLLAAADETGCVHIIDEVYKAGLENNEQANAVVACLHKWGLKPTDVLIAADPAMWAKKRQGESIGKADIEDFWSAGLRCVEANNNRRHGWSRVREFLHADNMLKVFKGNCPNLIRTMPLCVFDDLDPEDMDTTGDDHSEDALRYLLMTRPRPSVAPASAQDAQARHDEQIRLLMTNYTEQQEINHW